MKRQFTATVYIFHQQRVLLHRHAKHNKWLPPGGHLEENETPPEAARREVKEEANLDITFISQENLTIEAYNGFSIERPYLCLLEHIPERKEEPAHQHIDMIYLATLSDESQLAQIPAEFQWFDLNDIQLKQAELFPDCLQLLNQVMKTMSSQAPSLANKK